MSDFHRGIVKTLENITDQSHVRCPPEASFHRAAAAGTVTSTGGLHVPHDVLWKGNRNSCFKWNFFKLVDRPEDNWDHQVKPESMAWLPVYIRSYMLLISN